MNIAISGSTGFIGSHLSAFFNSQGDKIFPLDRNLLQKTSPRLTELLSNCEAVINLAGAPINHRWTRTYKQILENSRLLPAHTIVHAINSSPHPPKTLISASAIGIYPNTGCYNEYDPIQNNSFLSQLCQHWETEARKVRPETRCIITRFGIVLSPDGEAFKQLARPELLKTTIRIGPGTQYFPWIALKDLIAALDYLLHHSSLKGVYNLTAPQQINQNQLSREMAQHYHSFFNIKIPTSILRLLYGEGSTFLSQGQCVYPQRLQEAGFTFSTPEIKVFLDEIPTDTSSSIHSKK